jgi:hypothetical protein
MVREMACKTIDSKTLGKHWVERFMQRHPEVTSCIGVPSESSRALNSTHDIIAEHFRRVQNLIQSHGILSDDIWNMDVTGIAMGLCTNGCVISGKGKRRVYAKAPQNREWVSILEATSAGGRSIRPLMVFKGHRKHARKVYLSTISEAPGRHLV